MTFHDLCHFPWQSRPRKWSN